MLHDGSRLVLHGHSVQRRHQDGRVRDLSWWPAWKIIDTLRAHKVGGFDSHDEKELRAQLKTRRHPPFATLTAPVNWQDLVWKLGATATPKMATKFASGEQPYADVSVEGRLRFRVEAVGVGSARNTRVSIHDDGGLVNGHLVGAIARLLREGGKLERNPSPEGSVTLKLLDGSVLSMQLLREPVKALALLESVGASSRDVRVQCDVQWLVVHELTVRTDATRLVIDF